MSDFFNFTIIHRFCFCRGQFFAKWSTGAEVYTYAPGEAFFLVALSVRQISYLSGLCNPGALVDE
jgi:hypothetical protein